MPAIATTRRTPGPGRVDEDVAILIRMCRIPASGSSWKSFAREGVASDDAIRDSPVKKVSEL
jgi:hypothetical protein